MLSEVCVSGLKGCSHLTQDPAWHLIDLSHTQRWLTAGQSLLEYSTSVYALCELTERPVSVTTQSGERSPWYLWSSHPFQLWIDGHLLGRSDIAPRTLEESLISERTPIYGLDLKKTLSLHSPFLIRGIPSVQFIRSKP